MTSESVGSFERVQNDIEYLRRRIDEIYSEVHRGKKTDWVAVGTMSIVMLTIMGFVGNLIVGDIGEKISDQKARLIALEVIARDRPAQMEEIAKQKVNDLAAQINQKAFAK